MKKEGVIVTGSDSGEGNRDRYYMLAEIYNEHYNWIYSEEGQKFVKNLAGTNFYIGCGMSHLWKGNYVPLKP